MKAMVMKGFGDPQVFELSEIPKPQIKSGHVLVRVRASSVNPIDYKIRSGLLKDLAPENGVLGFDVAVNAVSEPDRKPDKTININKQIISTTVIVDIYLRVFLILSKFKLLLKKADPIFFIRTKLIFLLSFFLSFSIILKIFSLNILLSDIGKLFNLK